MLFSYGSTQKYNLLKSGNSFKNWPFGNYKKAPEYNFNYKKLAPLTYDHLQNYCPSNGKTNLVCGHVNF